VQRNFLAGPGEGIPLHSVSLYFEGVVRVEGTLLRCAVFYITNVWLYEVDSVSPRKTHVLFSTKDPPTIQRMPWPASEDEDSTQPHYSYDTWLLNDLDFAWLVDADGAWSADYPLAYIQALTSVRGCYLSHAGHGR